MRKATLLILFPGVSPEKEEEGDAAAQSPVCQPVWLSATMGDKTYQRSVRKVQWRLGQCLPQFAGIHNGPLSLRLARRILAALSPTDRALIESDRPASDLVVLTPVLALTFWTRLRDAGQLLPEVLHEFLYPEVASPEPAPAPPPEEDVILHSTCSPRSCRYEQSENISKVQEAHQFTCWRVMVTS